MDYIHLVLNNKLTLFFLYRQIFGYKLLFWFYHGIIEIDIFYI